MSCRCEECLCNEQPVTCHKLHPDSERFVELMNDHIDLHLLKQQDYGDDDNPFANIRASEEFGVPAWVGALIRMNDKMVRLKSMVRKGYLANESVEDSLRDLAVYATIALVLYEQAADGD